jgi:serine/threonine protein kinase
LEGVQIGGYRVLRQIGEGGMGAVWMAEHVMLGRRAAIKILHPSYSTRQNIVTRFFNEARAATVISDPGIIQIFDFGFHTDGRAYLVMELLDGEPLDHRLQRIGALPVECALRICRQVASAVGAAHARGIIHRDLKPENIFVIRDAEVPGGERAKVLDFGIAKLAGEIGTQQKPKNASAVMGTPSFMSPEQCRGSRELDQRSDVYSLGCVLFALVTGRAPFTAEGTGEIIMQHMLEPPPRPSTRSLGVPAEVDELILRCLAKSPADRFESGTELATAIDALLGRPSSLTLPAPRSPSEPSLSPGVTTLESSAAAVATSPNATRRGRGKLYASAAALLVAGGVAVAILASQTSSEPSETTPELSARPSVAEATKQPALPSPALPAPPPSPAAPHLVQAQADIRALLAAFSKWAAEHADAPCPTSTELGGSSDPWNHAYELTCTDQPANQIVGVVSMGPDGVAGTDDDLTSWTMGRDVTDLARGKRWTAATVAAKPTPPASPQPPDTAKKPTPNPAAAEELPRPKPSPPKPSKPPKPTGIVDFDGDGIPDTR